MARQVIPDTIPTMITVCQSSVVLFGDTVLLGSDVANFVDCIEPMLIVWETDVAETFVAAVVDCSTDDQLLVECVVLTLVAEKYKEKLDSPYSSE